MIIRLESTTAGDVTAARRDLAALARNWGHPVAETTDGPRDEAADGRGPGKVLDPVSLMALVISIPSAALAVADLADRIQKRRRAQELIGHAQQQAARHVSIVVMAKDHPVELSGLTPDQLLDLLDDDDTAPEPPG